MRRPGLRRLSPPGIDPYQSVSPAPAPSLPRLPGSTCGFGWDLFGCRHLLEYPLVKLLDYADRLEDLVADPNPFALVTAAHLLTRATQGDTERRYAAKWRLARLLYERDWDRQRIIDLFAVIDWMMRLPSELETKLWQELTTLECNKRMPYVTSDDASTQDPGDAADDRQDCRQARHAEACALVKRQIMRKLGRLPYMLGDHIDLLNLEQVRELSLALLGFNCVDDLGNWLIETKPPKERKRYITNPERIGYERGFRAARLTPMVQRRYRCRLGVLPPEIEDLIATLSPEHLDALAEAIWEITTLAELDNWFQQHPPDAWRLPLPTVCNEAQDTVST